MAAEKASTLVHDISLSKFDESLTSLITKDPLSIVKNYTAIHFDLPLLQKIAKFQRKTSKDFSPPHQKVMKFFIENPEYLSGWGLSFTDLRNEYNKKLSKYKRGNNELDAKSMEEIYDLLYVNFSEKFFSRFEVFSVNHIIMSEEVKRILFICDKSRDEYPYSISNPEHRSLKLVLNAISKSASIKDNQECIYPIEPVSYNNGILEVHLTVG